MEPIPGNVADQPVRAWYAERARAHDLAAAASARRSARLAQLRLGVFAAAVLAGLAAERGGGAWAWLGAAAALLVFVVLVARHRRVRTTLAEQQALAALNREGVARVARQWAALPERAAAVTLPATHGYAGDLDLFGPASLTQLLGPHGSASGGAVLDEWLLEPAPAVVAGERHAAVRELAAMAEWRERLALLARRAGHAGGGDIERFLAWAGSPPALGRRALYVLPWLLPALLWIPALAGLLVPLPPLWLPGAVLTLWYAGTSARAAHRAMDAAFGRESLFAAFPELFAHIHGAPFRSAALQQLQARLEGAGRPAHLRIAALRRIMNLADARFSSVHFVLQLAVLWDLHVLRALERWKRENGAAAGDWLRAAGEVEALAVFGTLMHDQPGWCLATFAGDDSRATFTAGQLGHPLIPDDERVANDVTLGPPGSFLLVTGSNMSGKSTLLRAIGLNAVLAQAGAPCCARTLRLAPLRLGSSIRVQDSLARGVSYFMAELERLKQVVDAADANRGRYLYLLDEILHGTNTAERRIAARRVIAHLVDSGAIGAVTTHDLELATGDELQALAVPVHFTEHFERDDTGTERMSFDYVLRPGLAPSTNALKLMELVGLARPG
jgi:hypothetical protein